METIITALLQLLLLALLVERVVDVVYKLFNVPPPKPESSPDWGIAGMLLSVALGLLVCYAYEFDLLKTATGAPAKQHVGMIITALVIAGGSAGVRAIIEVIRDNVKANRAEAQARMRYAKTADANTNDPSGAYARDLGLLAGWEFAQPAALTPIENRAAKAAKLCDAQGVYRRGCSEFVCAVLDIAYEQANELMGDEPQEITDWSKVMPGAIVGWKKTGGSGHVSVYVKDSSGTFIDVREPAGTSNPNPKPRRLSSYGSQKLYLSSRFGT